MKYVTLINNEQYEVEINPDGRLFINGEERHVDFLPLGSNLYSVITDDLSLQVVVEDTGREHFDVLIGGRMFEARVLDERALLMAQRKGGLLGGSGEVNSPMPGLIVDVTVALDDAVTQGQTVAILESMKMQNELKAPVDGVIESIHVQPGETVNKNTLLVVIKPNEE